jgi:hypothetical protein
MKKRRNPSIKQMNWIDTEWTSGMDWKPENVPNPAEIS